MHGVGAPEDNHQVISTQTCTHLQTGGVNSSHSCCYFKTQLDAYIIHLLMAEKKPSCFMEEEEEEEEEEENPVGSAYIEPITTRHWRSGPMGKETEELLTPSPGQECSVSSPR